MTGARITREDVAKFSPLQEKTGESLFEAKAALEDYSRIIQQDGVMLTGPDGKKQLHPLIGAIDRRETQQRQYGAMFGLDASSRAGLPIVESQELDKLEVWLAKSRAITAKRLARSAKKAEETTLP